MRRLVCPGCGKRGVTLRLGREDWYTCRYCQWTAANSGYYPDDVRGRVALATLNPEHPYKPGPEPEWALKED